MRLEVRKMFETISVKEAAILWGITERRVSTLCKSGKIKGAKKVGHNWMIPKGTEKPADGRIKSGNYISAVREEKTLLPLPIGISDYRLASSEYYYIDKTMMIKDFLDERPMVSLFTRPRRFGKTLNMDMLRTFFEKTDEDTSVYFKDKQIWACGKKYREYQGKYPVIFITFKDVKRSTWDETFDMIKELITSEYKRHAELAASDLVTDKKTYDRIINREATRTDYERSFLVLSQMLHEHHGIAPIIIIDEYDTPIEQGHAKGFYDEVISFMRNLFSGGLKDNKHLSYGFLTGILRVAKESIFSGLNNLTVNSVLDNKYSRYFGFTADEVKEMAHYYHADGKINEICEWYDGYQFGDTEIFNPWSVINYFRNDCQPRAYWQSTGSNEIIGEILAEADEDIYSRLNDLMQGHSFITYVDTGVIYPQIRNNPSSVYSFLLVAGYLKMKKADPSFSGDFMCEVALPNKEISFVFQKEILQKLDAVFPQSTAISIQEAIYDGNIAALQKSLGTLLMQSVSCYDAVGENFYHGLVLGLCAAMDNRFSITSNRESGEGRYDICLCPKNDKLPGILIELKAAKGCTEEELALLSEKALEQINDRKYETELMEKGVKSILKYGAAFSGKRVRVVVG